MSYHLAERTERQGRFHALVLAIVLHLALGSLLFLYTSEENVPQPKKNEPVEIKKVQPQAQVKEKA